MTQQANAWPNRQQACVDRPGTERQRSKTQNETLASWLCVVKFSKWVCGNAARVRIEMVADRPHKPVASTDCQPPRCSERSRSALIPSGPLPPSGPRVREPRPDVALGTLLLYTGAALTVLVVVDRTSGLPFSMPAFWYGNWWLWPALALTLVVGGAALLKRAAPRRRNWRPTVPGRRFDRAVVYTRRNCPLCDDALAVLLKYAPYLPPIEEVDVDSNPELADRFGECVPVVELDGKVRFRGRVDERLLRRLIEGTPPAASSRPASSGSDRTSGSPGRQAARRESGE